jgi:ABC-type cobalamin/Fe3+-siderophores transport system ATPase subunit
MPFSIAISRPNQDDLNLTLEAGQVLFVLGANGTGKSGLMQRFYGAHHQRARRITAHRQTWFESNSITMTPVDRRNTEQQMLSRDNNPDARWRDVYSSQRASIAIYDLIDAQNVRARLITDAIDSNDVELARTRAKQEAPIKVINELLRLSNMPSRSRSTSLSKSSPASQAVSRSVSLNFQTESAMLSSSLQMS